MVRFRIFRVSKKNRFKFSCFFQKYFKTFWAAKRPICTSTFFEMHDAADAIMSFNLPVILLLFWLLFGVFVLFLTPETIVLANLLYFTPAARFSPNRSRNPCNFNFPPGNFNLPSEKNYVISIYRPKNIWFQFTWAVNWNSRR